MQTKKWETKVTILWLCLGVASACPAKVIYVDADAAGGNDGTSWEDAYFYLQDALMFAVAGDEIHVAQGTYKPDDFVLSDRPSRGREETFQLINGVNLKGGYAGLGQADPDARDVSEYETILSGDRDGNDADIHYAEQLIDEPTRAENSYHVITGSGTDANAVLDGFTIRGGHANSASPHNQGGGMNNDHGSPTVVDCIFMRNAALDGGGVSNYFGNPTLSNCLFNDNGAFYSRPHGSGGNGGGMFNSQSNPTVVNCTFLNCYAYNPGGGAFNSGGSPTFTNCEFDENTSDGWAGAGMYNEECSPILSGCRFNGNWHDIGGSGGGMSNRWSDLILNNCRFSFNGAPDGGGGMDNWHSNVTLTDCTFVSNRADGGSFPFGGGMMNYSSSLTLTNCAFISNLAGNAGGGMYNEEHSVLMLTDCVFTDNEANRGGGMHNADSVVMLWNCALTSNEASYGDGGGIYNWYDSSLTLSGCRIVGNMGANGGGVYSEGGLYSEGGEATADNCLFIGNVAYDENGGAMCNEGEIALTVSNCTFAGNKAENGNALACDILYREPPGDVQFTNCILWDSGDEIWNNDGSIISVSYSDIQGGWSGSGNIDADPCFAGPGYWNPNGTPDDANDDFWVDGDYHLKSQAGRWDANEGHPTGPLRGWTIDDVTSPCLDAGDPMSPIGLEPFPNGGIINMGAYGGTAEASKSYFGKPPCETIVAGDVNGDCAVDFKDFMLMARHWLEEHDG